MISRFFGFKSSKYEPEYEFDSELSSDTWVEILDFREISMVSGGKKTEISLQEFSKRSKLPKYIIKDCLKEAGYILPENGDIILTPKYLEVILPKYIWSIKNSYRKFIKDKNILSKTEVELYNSFFNRFIYRDFFDFGNYGKNVELDNDLITSFFYYIVSSGSFYKNLAIFNKVYYKLKILIRKNYYDFREQLFSLIVSNHYHQFTGDEEHDRKGNSKMLLLCESRIREAQIKIIIYLKLYEWKINNY